MSEPASELSDAHSNYCSVRSSAHACSCVSTMPLRVQLRVFECSSVHLRACRVRLRVRWVHLSVRRVQLRASRVGNCVLCCNFVRLVSFPCHFFLLSRRDRDGEPDDADPRADSPGVNLATPEVNPYNQYIFIAQITLLSNETRRNRDDMSGLMWKGNLLLVSLYTQFTLRTLKTEL